MTGGEGVGTTLGAGGDSDTDEEEDKDETDEESEGGVDMVGGVNAASSSSIPAENQLIIVLSIHIHKRT